MAHVVSSRATFALALVFRLIMPAETGYIFGLIRYNFLRYCIVMFIAELPFAFFGVWVSDAFVDQHFILFFSALIGGGLFFFFFVWGAGRGGLEEKKKRKG